MQQSPKAHLTVSQAETIGPSLRDLEAFCLVVDHRSFTAVSRLLKESKATISRRIARVEEWVDTALLHRTTRHVVPTEDGAAYRERLRHVLELLDDAAAHTRGAQAVPHGRLRITAPPAFGAKLAPALIAFGARYPRVVIEAIVTSRVVDVHAEQVDVALRIAFALADSSLLAHRLLPVDVILVASPRYLEANRPPRTIADLRAHRMLLPTLGHEEKWRALGSADMTALLDLDLVPAVASSDMDFVRELALADGGIAPLPTLAVQQELSRGTLVRVLPKLDLPQAHLYLVHRGARIVPPKVRAFVDFMRDALGSRPARRRLRA